MGRLNGAFTGSGGDLRLNDGEVPSSQLGGACRRCGRSFVKREDSDGLCRDCSLAVGRKVAVEPPATRPEPAGGGGSVEASLPTCSVDDCLRAPSAFGKCRTHLEEERAARTPEPKPERDVKPEKEEPVAVAEVEKKACTIAGCFGDHLAKGWCAAHYHRVRRAVEAKLGTWDDGAFVKRALAGEFKGGSALTPAPKKKEAAPVAKPKKPRSASITVTKDEGGGPARFEASVRANGRTAELPADVAVMLTLAELEPETRARVLTWAQSRWPS